MRYSLSTIVALALLAPATHAQGPASGVASGDRVRVTVPSANLHRTKATFVGASSDSLYLAIARARLEGGRVVRDSAIVAVPFDGVTRLDVQRQGGYSLTGAGVGAMVGVVLYAGGGTQATLFGGTAGALIGAGGLRALKKGLKGALWTAPPMAVLGMAVGAGSEGNGCWIGPCNAGEGLAIGAVAGAFLGFVGGGVVGALSRNEWYSVPLEPHRVSVAPYVAPRSLGASVSIQF